MKAEWRFLHCSTIVITIPLFSVGKSVGNKFGLRVKVWGKIQKPVTRR